MADNIIPVDFGKEYNEAAASMAKLLGMVEEQRAQIMADPIAFVREAHKEIARLRREMQRARDALRRPFDVRPISNGAPPSKEPGPVRIMPDDYEALRRCEAVVRGWDKSR